jgi:hypothetical protein
LLNVATQLHRWADALPNGHETELSKVTPPAGKHAGTEDKARRGTLLSVRHALL